MDLNQKETHVIQVGEIQGDRIIYFEDYAHTYFKKQNYGEEGKYFIYGKRKREEEKENIYIYGLSRSPKLEKTYFTEYAPLGFLRTREEKIYLNLKGKESLLNGYYIFYAANQAMQDYLVEAVFTEDEFSNEKKEIKTRQKIEQKPIREISVPRPVFQGIKKQNASYKGVVVLGGVIAGLTLFAISKAGNSEESLAVFKEIVGQVVNLETALGRVGKDEKGTSTFGVEDDIANEIIIEEKEFQAIGTLMAEEEGLAEELSLSDGVVQGENIGLDGVGEEENTSLHGVDKKENAALDVMKEEEILQQKEMEGEDIALQKEEEGGEVEGEENKVLNGTKEEEKLQQKEMTDEVALSDGTTGKDTSSVKAEKEAGVGVEIEQENVKKEDTEAGSQEKKLVTRIEHTVKEGETLIGICKKYYGTLHNLKEICSINNIDDEDFIAPGQKIYLPE